MLAYQSFSQIVGDHILCTDIVEFDSAILNFLVNTKILAIDKLAATCEVESFLRGYYNSRFIILKDVSRLQIVAELREYVGCPADVFYSLVKRDQFGLS